ncbi:PEP-CTERM sorting domain-containing protein [Rugamonas rubra]|uniref:PEP-CTERM protein-sorting domain-containing protein n=1 Tax=Rugamonas rubra TaxID=758825 RepID=A0A1I4U215_9BURK|nr:PEP-CTERM sorting domain-containing protein [Rugamonas rubra]SFM82939.1 PEP-CTERM protein-sorting domain-containing protein [Rugamonas rubra]
MRVQIKLAIMALTLGLGGLAGATPLAVAAPAPAVPAFQLDDLAAATLLDGLEQADLRDFAGMRAGLDEAADDLPPGRLAPAQRGGSRAGLDGQARAQPRTQHPAAPPEPIPEPEIYTMFLVGIAILLLAGRRRDVASPWGMIRVDK